MRWGGLGRIHIPPRGPKPPRSPARTVGLRARPATLASPREQHPSPNPGCLYIRAVLRGGLGAHSRGVGAPVSLSRGSGSLHAELLLQARGGGRVLEQQLL